MFGFLAPTAMIGLALLSVPILLHIFKPRKVRQTPFSSLRWLRASQHRLSRRIKWHQVLLFALRAGLITCLVLALAKPIFAPAQAGGKADRFIILDVGMAMGYQRADGSTPLEDGRRLALTLLARTAAGDRTSVILAGAQARALGPLAADPSAYQRPLQTLRPEAGPADLTQALRLVGPMTAGENEAQVIDLYFITNNLIRNWSQGPIARFLEGPGRPQVRVHVLDVGSDAVENAWIAQSQLLSGPAGRQTLQVQIGAMGDQPQKRRLRITGLPGLPEQSQELQLQQGRFISVSFDLPAEFRGKGAVAQLELLPADNLAADDVSWLNLDASGALRVVVVEPDITAVEELQPGFHLRSALAALADANPGALAVSRGEPEAVLAPTLAQADLIILVDVPSLSPSNLEAIRQRVQAGAGLVVFLGPLAQSDFYNREMHDPLRPSQSLLPVDIGPVVALRGAEGGLPRIAHIDWTSPLFARLFDPEYGDLGQTRFSACRQINLAKDDAAIRVLATIAATGPAILESRCGAGKVILFNTTASDQWSDLPRRKSFVPVIDRLLRDLAGELGRGAFHLGEPVVAPLPAGAGAIEDLVVTAPAGGNLKPVIREAGGRTLLQLDNLTEVGPYQVRYETAAGPGGFPLVVLGAPSQSMLSRLEVATLQNWWRGAEFQCIPAAGKSPSGLADDRLMLEPYLIGMACLLLLAEMFFVHWLCPKMNPAVTSRSVVWAQGSLLAPMESEQRAAPAQAAAPPPGQEAVHPDPEHAQV